MRFFILFFLAFATLGVVKAQQTAPCGVCKVGQVCNHSKWFCNNCKTKYWAEGNSPTCPNVNCRSTTAQWRDSNPWGTQPQTTPQWQSGGWNGQHPQMQQPQNSPWNQSPQQMGQPQLTKPTIQSGQGNNPWKIKH